MRVDFLLILFLEAEYHLHGTSHTRFSLNNAMIDLDIDFGSVLVYMSCNIFLAHMLVEDVSLIHAKSRYDSRCSGIELCSPIAYHADDDPLPAIFAP